MKLTKAVIYGFGKFYQRSFAFQDGIHVIYGPNEAGKSTLHTFLGCMLFGLERGRGRAARGDLYSRYLPWDHDATYGGSLTLETEEQTYHIHRSFRSDHRCCQLAADGQMPADCSESTLAQHCHEGLTESLYYNTVSIRSLGCAPDASLAQELTRQLTDLSQSGSDTIQYSRAASWLRAQHKQLESLLTPDLEQQILTRQQSIAHLQTRLQNTSFQERKALLQMDLEDCFKQLAALSLNDHDREDDSPHESGSFSHSSRSRSGFSVASILLSLCFGAGTYLLWSAQHTVPAVITGILALLFLLTALLRRGSSDSQRISDPDEFADEDDREEEDSDTEGPIGQDPDQDPDPRAQRLQQRIQSLQNQYEAVCRQEWDYDHLLEQAQHLEEELEQLTLRQNQEEEIRMEIQAIALASSTLQKLSTRMQDHTIPLLGEEMSRILAGITGSMYTKVFVDGQLRVSVQTRTVNADNVFPQADCMKSPAGASAASRTVPLESLSRGTIEQVYLAMRLAVIELLFPQGGMPLILDDCFLTYDDERLTSTLSWLAEHYSGQILIFTCQKREAALLSKEQIPFTHMLL